MLRLATISLAVLLLAPALARASGDAVITDCTHNGALTRTYSQKDYDAALANLPADVDEYGDCRQIIRDAQLAAAGGGGGAGGGIGGSPAGSIPGIGPAEATPKNPQEKAALARAVSKGDAPIKIAGSTKPLVPGASSFSADGVSSGLPLPVIIVLVLMGLAALVGAGVALRPQIERVLSRRRG